MSGSPAQESWDERIDRVTTYIEEHVRKIEKASDVAAIVDVSYQTLRKRFRRQIGIPIGKYIQQTRIDEACQLLVETDAPVYVVCWRVGYSSDSNGIRAFKRHTGMTMEEYRKQYGNGAD